MSIRHDEGFGGFGANEGPYADYDGSYWARGVSREPNRYRRYHPEEIIGGSYWSGPFGRGVMTERGFNDRNAYGFDGGRSFGSTSAPSWGARDFGFGYGSPWSRERDEWRAMAEREERAYGRSWSRDREINELIARESFGYGHAPYAAYGNVGYGPYAYGNTVSPVLAAQLQANTALASIQTAAQVVQIAQVLGVHPSVAVNVLAANPATAQSFGVHPALVQQLAIQDRLGVSPITMLAAATQTPIATQTLGLQERLALSGLAPTSTLASNNLFGTFANVTPSAFTGGFAGIGTNGIFGTNVADSFVNGAFGTNAITANTSNRAFATNPFVASTIGLNNVGLNNVGLNNVGLNNVGLNNSWNHIGLNNVGLNNIGMTGLGLNNVGLASHGANAFGFGTFAPHTASFANPFATTAFTSPFAAQQAFSGIANPFASAYAFGAPSPFAHASTPFGMTDRFGAHDRFGAQDRWTAQDRIGGQDRFGAYERFGFDVAPFWGNADMSFGDERSHYARGPKGYKRSDDRVREEVCDLIARFGFVDASDVEISVDSGVVRLTGTVAWRRDKRVLEQLCERVPGVDEVRNELRLSRRETDWERYQVKQAMQHGPHNGKNARV